MLLSFLKRSEAVLAALSGVVEDAGHSDHKGSPREFFLFHFLRELVGEAFGIGTGEIIDEDSKPGETRRQNDIVIYDKHFPKLHLGGGCYAFFAESVIATIEVKSNLTEEKLTESLDLIHAIKKLKQNRTFKTTDYHPPGIVSYIFAYKGPVKLKTTLGHLKKYIATNAIPFPQLPKTQKERMTLTCPLADCICVLDQGVIQFDNAIHDLLEGDAIRKKKPKHCWISLSDNVLFWFYLHLTAVLITYSADAILDPSPYFKNLTWTWTFDKSK